MSVDAADSPRTFGKCLGRIANVEGENKKSADILEMSGENSKFPRRIGDLPRDRAASGDVVPPRLAERRRGFEGDLDRELIPPGGFEEKGESGESFAVDVLGLEEGEHLLRQPPDFGRASLAEIEDRQVEGDHGGVVADPLGDEAVAGGEVVPLGRRKVAPSGGDVGLEPEEAELKPRLLDLSEEIGVSLQQLDGLLMLPHFLEVESQVVVPGDVEDWIRGGPKPLQGRADGLDSTGRISAQPEDIRELEERPRGVIQRPSQAEKQGRSLQEPFGFFKAALVLSQRSLKVIDSGHDLQIGDPMLCHHLARQREVLIRFPQATSCPTRIRHEGSGQSIEIKVSGHPGIAIRDLPRQVCEVKGLLGLRTNVLEDLLEEKPHKRWAGEAASGSVDSACSLMWGKRQELLKMPSGTSEL